MTDVVLVDGVRMTMWCPGCESVHVVGIGGPNPWSWNGDLEYPTLHPSVLVLKGENHPICHSFVTGGTWMFLPDCGHQLAGQNVPMPAVDEWPGFGLGDGEHIR